LNLKLLIWSKEIHEWQIGSIRSRSRSQYMFSAVVIQKSKSFIKYKIGRIAPTLLFVFVRVNFGIFCHDERIRRGRSVDL